LWWPVSISGFVNPLSPILHRLTLSLRMGIDLLIHHESIIAHKRIHVNTYSEIDFGRQSKT